MTVVTLKQARAVATRVGAQIKQVGEGDFEVRLGVPRVEGDASPKVWFARTPREAAHVALIETAKSAYALLGEAKKIYVDEDLLLEVKS